MIPFFSYHTIPLGPVVLQVWGILVAIGFLSATALALRWAVKQGIEKKIIWDLSFIAVVAGMIGGRLGHVFFYDWNYYAAHLIEIPMIWRGGLSSYGGFILAGAASLLYLRWKRQNLIQITDTTLAALPLGWAIGRIGCFLIHDHPGTLTSSPFGVQFPEGTRFDMGMIDGIIALTIFLTAYPVYRATRKTMPGFTSGYVLSSYAILRFLSDFLRAADLPNSDPRIFGLTPAQHASVVFFFIGVWLLVRATRRRATRQGEERVQDA